MMRKVVLQFGLFAASVFIATVAAPQEEESGPGYRVRNPKKIAALGISDKDVRASVGVARSFLTKWTDINPGGLEVGANLYGQPRLEIGRGLECRLEVDYKSKEVRSFYCSDEAPSAAGRMSEREALKRMESIAQSLGLPAGATLARTNYRSSGTAKTLARDLYHAIYGFKKEGIWIPASYVHLSMNLRTGTLSSVSVDRRKYVVDSWKSTVSKEQAQKIAREYAIDHHLVHHSDNPDPGRPEIVSQLYYDKRSTDFRRLEDETARFRLAWMFRYKRVVTVYVDAATGFVLDSSTCR